MQSDWVALSKNSFCSSDSSVHCERLSVKKPVEAAFLISSALLRFSEQSNNKITTEAKAF